MDTFIRRINVATQPYFEETEASREERKLNREKFFSAARQAILFTLGVTAVVVLRVALGF